MISSYCSCASQGMPKACEQFSRPSQDPPGAPSLPVAFYPLLQVANLDYTRRPAVIVLALACPLDNGTEDAAPDKRYLAAIDTCARHYKLELFLVTAKDLSGQFTLLSGLTWRLLSSPRFKLTDECVVVALDTDERYTLDSSEGLTRCATATNYRKLYFICMHSLLLVLFLRSLYSLTHAGRRITKVSAKVPSAIIMANSRLETVGFQCTCPVFVHGVAAEEN